MAGAHPDPVGHRIAYDRDAKMVIWYDNILGPSTTVSLNPTQITAMNDETDGVALNPGTGADEFIVSIVFKDEMDMEGFFIDYAGGTIDAVSVSSDTTNGVDGTWVNAVSTPVGSTAAVNPAYRDAAEAFPADTDAVKAVRFRHSGIGSQDIKAFHLYGTPNAIDYPHRLALWNPSTDVQIVASYLDCGDVPRGSSQDKQFRIKNLSPTIAADNVTITPETLTDAAVTTPGQWLFSYNGSAFTATVNVGTITASGYSGIITARRVTPSAATVGCWAQRFIVASTTATIRPAVEYAYFGDISNNVPTPHIWFLSPASGRAGDSVIVFGHGFGATQGTYTGVAKYAGVVMSITAWAQIAGSVDALNANRVIDSILPQTTPEHQVIIATIPSNAVDGLITVETNA